LDNRGQYAFFVTVTLAMIVLGVASVLVLPVRGRRGASITAAGGGSGGRS
jgi:heme exporter protein D